MCVFKGQENKQGMHFKQSSAFLSWKWPHISAGYRAVLFWCDSIVSSGWLNGVPSQHCSPEALKHFGDKHRLAVKRATEEKAYLMSSQWAVSCIIRPGPQIRWRLKFDARQQNSVPSTAVWSGSCAGCLMELSWWCVRPPPSPPLPSRNERLELREGERRERREGGGSLALDIPPVPFPALLSGGRSQS